MALTSQQTSAISATLSPARLGTYLNAAGATSGPTALDIYVWNALISGAFFSTLHVCEIVIRKAISHALELKYGANWPWDPGFERTLSEWFRRELQSARKSSPPGSTGKVIAEMTFGFWCHLFTARHDQHIWNAHLNTVFPFLPLPLNVPAARKMLFDDMEALRGLRNRIAHHEPIFAYPLASHQMRIERLIKLRCRQTAHWVSGWEIVTATLAARP